MTFGESAVRLSAAAAQLLGWKPSEFWEATPADLALALGTPAATGDAPDRSVIDELRRQFPDD